MKRGILAFLCCAIAATSTAYAGTTGVLHGFVRNQQGEPIQGAIVHVVSASKATLLQSDVHGFFVAIDLPPDQYTVSVEKDGFGTYSYPNLRIASDHSAYLILPIERAFNGCCCHDPTPFAADKIDHNFTSVNVRALSEYPPPFPYLAIPVTAAHPDPHFGCL